MSQASLPPTAPRRAPSLAPMALGMLMVALFMPLPAWAIELCGEPSKTLMRSVGITEQQIQRLCEAAEEASRLTRLSLRRAEDESGYCRVTLELRNDSIHQIDSFVLTTAGGRFEIFRFHDVIPGRSGYASALSRSLMDCRELAELGVEFIWPGSVRADGRALSGRLLDQFRPALLGKELRWKE